MIELKHIDKTFNRGTVSTMKLFEDFNLSVKTGEFVSVVGSNGSGKTSMLNIICGSIAADSGEVLLNGENINKLPEYRRYRKIGRVYQNTAFGSCPDMTILENMSLAENKGKPYNFTIGVNKKKAEYYKELLSGLGLGLEDKLNVKMGLLSGGQRQAVSLIMATMTPIDFLILDEHTAALDPHTADVIMELTEKVVKEKNLTSIMVTHNLRYAVEYGDRILMMDKGNIILDKEGEEKQNTTVDSLLDIFNKISIECGN